MKLGELFTPFELRDAVDAKLVNVQHSGTGLRIFNYSKSAPYTPGAWDNPAVLHSRGLIVDHDNNIVARAWSKFFNLDQQPGGLVSADDMHKPVEVTDKMDGSLGIVYRDHDLAGTLRVATRGSFKSPQALKATELLHLNNSDLLFVNSVTPLVEIIYPENRIVCDYGPTEDLVLLGGVVVETGEYLGPDETYAHIGWRGLVTQRFPYNTLAEAMTAEDRAGAEGIVIRFVGENRMVKIKQGDYLHLHRILTGTSARNLWEALVVEQCQHLIKEHRHWGTYLGMDPARADECLHMGPDWRTRILDAAPDEFHAWVNKTLNELDAAARRLFADKRAEVEKAKRTYSDDKDGQRRRYEYLASSLAVKQQMEYLRTGDDTALRLWAWSQVEPAPTKPFEVSEDVA